MLVRARNTTNNPNTDPYSVGPSTVAYSRLLTDTNFTPLVHIDHLDYTDTVLVADNS